MDYEKLVKLEINEEHQIIHYSIDGQLHLSENNQFRTYAKFMLKKMKSITTDHRWYIIFDMTNLIIEPSLSDVYAEFALKMYQKYIHPEGASRYGSAITRVTVKMSHEKNLKKSAQIYRNRDEAFRYIFNLIDERESIGGKTTRKIQTVR